MFCAPGLVFGGKEGVRSHFQVLCSRTNIRRCRGRWDPFSCFALLHSLGAVSRSPSPLFIFCAPVLILGSTEGAEFSFHVPRSRARFRRYQGRRVPFSYFALPDSFWAVARASGPVFMFCASGLILGGTEGARSLFLVYNSRAHFWRYRGRRILFSCFALLTRFGRYRGRQVPFPCFALPNSFSAVSRASGPIFMFCTLGLVLGGTEGVGSLFLVLHSRTRFRRYRGRRVPFSCFALVYLFWAILRATGPVFMFCTTRPVLGGTEGVGSDFHVLPNRLILGGTVSVRTSFQVLRSRTHFRWYRGCRVPYSCSHPSHFRRHRGRVGPVFMFCAPGLVFGGTEGAWTRLYVLRSRTHFGR
jgi:hypothetical protein